MNILASLLLVAAVQTPQQEAVTVRVEPANAEVAVETRQALSAVVTRADGAVVRDAGLRWVSTNPAVVSVDSTGTVLGLAPGAARVYAVYGNQGAGFVDLVVPQLPPAEIELALEGGRVPVGTGVPLRVVVRSRLGDVLASDAVRFTSLDPGVATVDATGRVSGIAEGRATVRASAGAASSDLEIRIVENPARDYRLEPTEEQVRTGDVVRFRVTPLDARGRPAGTSLPAWSVSGPDASIEAEGGVGVFVAEQPGTYTVTALIGPNAMRQATVRVETRSVPSRVTFVGRGAAGTHHSGDTWVFEGVDGRDYAIVGTFMHDWAKVWDVTDPASPALTDSIQLDARRINDVKIHPNGRIGILTREGASNRRNGIVLLDLSTPAHPTILSEYTETVTGGVHNTWVRGELDLLYAAHNGTSDVHIIDISDPSNPREVGRWGLDRPSKTLHDVIVQDGYAYLSYWDDGVVMLDVGAGSHGGTPTAPTFVSSYSYPEGNTHVAWRHGRYLYVGDEIFPDNWNPEAPIDARGFIHVLDMTDIENPVEVARYEVPEAGAHNVWVEDDVLYVGYYQGGLRAVDVSGELRGDLYRQGRELGAYRTAAEDAMVPNWPMTWGAQVFKGNVFTSDLNSGLWVLKLEPERPTS